MAEGTRRVRGQRRRGWSEEGPRTNQVVLKFSDKEKADLDEVSGRLGMGTGAWAAEMLVRYARGQVAPIPADWRDLIAELLKWRTDVVRAGTVVNQVARHANSLGEFEEETGRLLDLVERLLTRVDEATEQASRKAGRAR